MLIGWRDTTIDVDMKLDPEPEGVFEALPGIKDELNINIELASPDQFVPPFPDWKQQSQLIAQHDQVEFRHFDFSTQALSKIERGHERDLADVSAMVKRDLVDPRHLLIEFAEIKHQLARYPHLDADVLEAKLEAFVRGEVHG